LSDGEVAIFENFKKNPEAGLTGKQKMANPQRDFNFEGPSASGGQISFSSSVFRLFLSSRLEWRLPAVPSGE
jgi:hypothetical protein